MAVNKLNKKNIFKLIRDIKKESDTVEPYNTDLPTLQEKIIIASYRKMPLDKLISYRFILNKEIKKKKEERRIKNSLKPISEDKVI